MPPPRRDGLVDRTLWVWHSKFISEAFLKVKNLSTSNKAAFTLAEVLITLGIIGVVAAMTMPAVIGHYKKQETVSRLKKAYTILNQALKLSENDNGEYEYWDDASRMEEEAYLNKYWLPYFNVLKVCNTASKCGYKSTLPWFNYAGVNSARYISILTGDGISYSISTNNLLSFIFVDLNGLKAPNEIGKDLFAFSLVSGRGILPSGYNKTSTEIDNNCSEGDRFYCAAKIIKDGWQILSDYPY